MSQKNLHKIVCLQSEKRQEWIQEERDYKGFQRAGAVLLSGQLVGHVVPWKKRVSTDLL